MLGICCWEFRGIRYLNDDHHQQISSYCSITALKSPKAVYFSSKQLLVFAFLGRLRHIAFTPAASPGGSYVLHNQPVIIAVLGSTDVMTLRY